RPPAPSPPEGGSLPPSLRSGGQSSDGQSSGWTTHHSEPTTHHRAAGASFVPHAPRVCPALRSAPYPPEGGSLPPSLRSGGQSSDGQSSGWMGRHSEPTTHQRAAGASLVPHAPRVCPTLRDAPYPPEGGSLPPSLRSGGQSSGGQSSGWTTHHSDPTPHHRAAGASFVPHAPRVCPALRAAPYPPEGGSLPPSLRSGGQSSDGQSSG